MEYAGINGCPLRLPVECSKSHEPFRCVLIVEIRVHSWNGLCIVCPIVVARAYWSQNSSLQDASILGPMLHNTFHSLVAFPSIRRS